MQNRSHSQFISRRNTVAFQVTGVLGPRAARLPGPPSAKGKPTIFRSHIVAHGPEKAL